MNRLLLLSGLAVVATTCWVVPASSDSIDVNGVTRTFIAQLSNTKPAPLVIVLHGNAETGADMASRTIWPALARQHGFGVVFPDGHNRAWADFRRNDNRPDHARPEYSDNVDFIVRLIGKFIADETADPKHIYITGVSKGGAMAMAMICGRADLFNAAASVIINLSDESAASCHPSRAVPLLMMNGTADPLIPYEGSRVVGGFWSTAKTLEFWRRVNGCETQDTAVIDLDDRNPSDKTTATRIESQCPPGRDVVLYRINNGGHRMPGTLPDTSFPRPVNTSLGPQNRGVDGAGIIWAFFRKFQ